MSRSRTPSKRRSPPTHRGGIEITTELVRSGAIANLDLSVIYGEALFADVILPPGTLPSLESALKFDTRRTFDKPYPRNHGWAQDPETTLRLRLYSTAALEKWALLDYLKDWKTEAFLRYLPVALWALGVTSGGPGLVVASVADQVLSSWQSYYERQDFDPSTAALYGNIQWATTAVPGSQLFFEASSDFIRASFGGQFSLSAHRGNIAQFVYSAAIAWAVAGSDWYLTKDVRAITANTRGYCRNGDCGWSGGPQIPPIQVIGIARGPAERPRDHYPSTRVRMAAFNLL